MEYLTVKWIHILSSTLLFGTGLGTAFHMWMTHLSGEPRAIARAARNTVWADWLFTTPSVIIQPLSGAYLVHLAGFGWTEDWLIATYVLYAVAGLCWLPVVGLQIRARKLAEQAVADQTEPPDDYHRIMRWWFALGWPAFIAVICIFWLMVTKPVLDF
ncbi:MAG: DUF2269 domain-containing protein [Alphaproteobacteria bacterium]